MKAAVTNDQHGFDVVDVPDPAPGPTDLIIRVAACGVCGSDIKAQPYMPAGFVMGHELGGEVVAVGSDTRDWAVGTNIAVLPVVLCGNCVSCADGVVAHCSQTRYIGMGPDRGGFAEFAVVPTRHSFALPDTLPEHYAALVEPFAVGLHGVHTAEISSGEDVLVIGAGGVGLTTVAWARAKGAQRITVADPDPQRRGSALAVGATDVVASAEDAKPGTYDAAIECVGHPELLQACQTALRARGRIVVSGACDQPMPIEPVTALLKELTIKFAVCYRPDEFRETIRFHRSHDRSNARDRTHVGAQPDSGGIRSRPERQCERTRACLTEHARIAGSPYLASRIRGCSAATPAITAYR